VAGEDRVAMRAPTVRPGSPAGGERLEGFIYGTVVALAGVIAGARTYPHEAGHVAALVAVTSSLLWLAHVYAHGLGRSVSRGERLHVAELRHVARHELAIVLAAVPPIVALLIGAFGLVSTGASYWLAFGTGLAVLTAQGLRFAQMERLGTIGTIAVVTANLGFGLLLIGLKLLVAH
jgi:hypothetical protein